MPVFIEPLALCAPIEVTYKERKCGHTIIFKHHYEREEWEAAADRVRVVAGNCLVCGQAVVGRRGWSKYQSLHNHLFEICTEYPYSNAYSNVN